MATLSSILLEDPMRQRSLAGYIAHGLKSDRTEQFTCLEPGDAIHTGDALVEMSAQQVEAAGQKLCINDEKATSFEQLSD